MWSTPGKLYHCVLRPVPSSPQRFETNQFSTTPFLQPFLLPRLLVSPLLGQIFFQSMIWLTFMEKDGSLVIKLLPSRVSGPFGLLTRFFCWILKGLNNLGIQFRSFFESVGLLNQCGFPVLLLTSNSKSVTFNLIEKETSHDFCIRFVVCWLCKRPFWCWMETASVSFFSCYSWMVNSAYSSNI